MFCLLVSVLSSFQERACDHAGVGGQRERENIKQAPRPSLEPSASALLGGSISPPWDHDLSRNQELDA